MTAMAPIKLIDHKSNRHTLTRTYTHILLRLSVSNKAARMSLRPMAFDDGESDLLVLRINFVD